MEKTWRVKLCFKVNLWGYQDKRNCKNCDQEINVVDKAIEAFGCSTFKGIELEEFGGEGTAGLH